MKRGKIAILLALSLSITSALAGCGASSKASLSAAAAQTEEGMQDEAAPEELQTADQAGVGNVPAVAAANLTEEEASNPVPDQFHVELEEVSRVSGKDNYKIRDDALLYVEGDNYTFCDFSGKPVDSRPVHNVDYLGWNLFSVTLKSEDDINCTGLVDTAGTVLIPFSAAIIEFPGSHPEDERPRYVLVYTGTGVTSNEDEALFSAWKYRFACITGDEEVLYKGTLRVFDLVTEQYIPGLEYASANRYNFRQIGDRILADIGDKTVVYSPDGKEFYTEQGALNCNYRYMLDYDNGQYVIMDANGSRLYATDSYLGTIDYNSKYFMISSDNKYGAIDCRGETLLPMEYNYISGETKDRFIIYNGNSNYTLVAQDGSIITSGTYIFEATPLGFLRMGDGNRFSLITPGNRIIDGINTLSNNLIYTKNDRSFYLVLNTGDFVSCGDSFCYEIGKGVIRLNNNEYKYKLVDVFTGNDLTGFDYDLALRLNADYFCVEEGDDIVIYTPVIVPEG